jgi:hypothetical protein
LILALLGAALMAWPLASPGEIVTNDAASFGSFTISDGPSGPKVTISTPAVAVATAPTAPTKSRAEIDAALKKEGLLP